MTKIDNKSYLAHNAEYESSSDLDYCKKRFAEYEQNNYFEKLGFKKVIDDHPEVRSIHIDIGSGAGWLQAKTASYFDRVIGIEPSKAAVGTARQITESFGNVEYLNDDMAGGLEKITLNGPALFTSSTVFSHINDESVADFLKILSRVPPGSVLFFREPYGKNYQQYLWHIRSKEWWASRLPDWELTFCGYTGNGYENGISGVLVGRENVKNNFRMGIAERAVWHLSGIPSGIRRQISSILSLLK